MPPKHQAIMQNNEMYGKKDLLLATAKNLCPEVYNFCLKKLSISQSQGANEYNALRTCQGVINFYVKNSAKDIVAQCCTALLSRSPKMWNTPCLKELYINKSSNYIAQNKNAPAQIVRTNQEQAHLRTFTDDGNADSALDNFLSTLTSKKN